MTDPYTRQADDSADATIPLVPDDGYAATEPVPFAEDTLVDPVGTSPWSAAAADSLTAPGYGLAGAGYGQAGQPPAPPAAPTPAPLSTPHGQSAYGQPGTNYVQPQAYPTPQAYPAPQAYPTPAAGFAEPSGPADSIGARNVYQGYPAAKQQQAWPAVIPDPVAYDYGYGRQPAASEHPSATTSLVLGIIGLAFFQVLSPVAWFIAAKGRREMAAYPGRWRNSGALTAGFVLGIIGTLLLGLVAMVVLVALVALMATGV